MKVMTKIILTLILFFVLMFYVVYPLVEWYESRQPPFGSSSEDQYIVIRGKKSLDAHITAYGTFFGGGETCKSFSWSASDGKKRKGGKADILFEHNFSESNDSYELRLPFHNFISSGCDMKLHQIEVEAKNDFDQVGFAKLRLYKTNKNNEKPLSFSTFIEAKNCEPYYSEKFNRWTNGFGCYYYIDGKKKSQDQEFNAYTVYYDFSKFNNDTVIHYDILAGENYRSEPLDKEKGPQ
ncbi:hypothetical protein EAY03_14595 [Vibrio anguillarum]|uniref:Uncharacterized protein n=3 Tax=Vibrionaceae TaxID=641 RepID=A0A3M7LJT2_VIBAN|nr:hypothetical protein DD610_16420 [Vibrio anguillarum]AZS26880.1 hypothetical protein DYL72_18065 [Vibrio anguillarum]MBF4311078.1 hypothetical protein [Vibrio anguillarum]MBF4325681.1 hypothetical protein [Vibrio anguillarum]MBT2913306.1 hypothetical protein [Vibrio anguillarum]